MYCDGTSWVGEPEKGIWCYTSPKNPGPREDPAQEEGSGYHLLSYDPCILSISGTESDIYDEEAGGYNGVTNLQINISFEKSSDFLRLHLCEERSL